MTRRLFLTMAVLSMGVLLGSSAAAVTPVQCEEASVNCQGRCADRTGGAGDLNGRPNKCLQACVRRLMRCYPSHRTPEPVLRAYFRSRAWRPLW